MSPSGVYPRKKSQSLPSEKVKTASLSPQSETDLQKPSAESAPALLLPPSSSSPQITPESVDAATARLSDDAKPKRRLKKLAVDPGPVGEQVQVSLDEAKYVLRLPFDSLAVRTGYAGFRLPDSKVDDCAPLMDKVLKKYCPAMEGEHAALLALSFSLLPHAVTSCYGYYQYVKAERAKEVEAESEVGVPA